jgi:hypothetical protein
MMTDGRMFMQQTILLLTTLMYINNQDGTFTNRAAQWFETSNIQQYGYRCVRLTITTASVDIVVVDMLPEENKRWKLTSRGQYL